MWKLYKIFYVYIYNCKWGNVDIFGRSDKMMKNKWDIIKVDIVKIQITGSVSEYFVLIYWKDFFNCEK